MNSITYMSASVNLREQGCALQGAAAAQSWFGLSPRTTFCSRPVAPHLCQLATLSRRGSAGSGTRDQTLQKKRGATAMGHTGHFPWGNW